MEKELKSLLGIGYEVAATIGEKLGWALNDLIDKAFSLLPLFSVHYSGER